MDLLTIIEVADALKVSLSTVRRLIGNGDIAAFKVGNRGQLRIERKDLERYVKENKVTPLSDLLDDEFSKER